jgi:hypothetical protein
MIRDPDSPLSFDLAAAFGRHQPGRGRGGRVMPTHPPLHHGGEDLGDRMSPLAGPPRTCVRGATLTRRDWIGTGEGLGSAAALVAGTRVGRSLCLCLRPPVPTR